MPTRSTVLGFLTIGLLVAVPMLLIMVHSPRSTVQAATLTRGPEHVTVCFNKKTHLDLALAFVNAKLATEQHQGCGVGLVQVQLDLDTARELLGSIVATLNARDQAIEREKLERERDAH